MRVFARLSECGSKLRLKTAAQHCGSELRLNTAAQYCGSILRLKTAGNFSRIPQHRAWHDRGVSIKDDERVYPPDVSRALLSRSNDRSIEPQY
jgi:hypothetical protein